MPPDDPRQRSAPLPPNTRGIADALGEAGVLVSLVQRVRASNARLAAVQPLLPAAMRPMVQAGPLDDEGWTLLAANTAVAAKLRQMLPALLAQLRLRQLETPALRVKLLTRR